ncbi:MAG: nucleotidyltransferase domain-containing protein [Candidatus Caenarcaniphilales bacterium]|nr:nucleotidyltransferase domain-containing protein [Candidatus Caenarcaniphilales bacterium]
MKSLQEVKSIIFGLKPYLREKYGVLEVEIFGSYSRDEQTQNSDLDLIITLDKPLGFEFLDLCDYLDSQLDVKVDILTQKGIKKNFYNSIKGDIVHV